MSGPQLRDVKAKRKPVNQPPFAGDHHPVSPMGAAKDQRCQRITRAGKTQLVKGEERQIGLASHRDLADVGPAKAARRTPCRPAERIEVGHGRIIGEAVHHQRMSDTFHQVGTVV